MNRERRKKNEKVNRTGKMRKQWGWKRKKKKLK